MVYFRLGRVLVCPWLVVVISVADVHGLMSMNTRRYRNVDGKTMATRSLIIKATALAHSVFCSMSAMSSK